ncbi:hypothetical protein, partial [Vibrio sp. 10N.247.310.34]|uniref:hypothetical protein n=1 Tax=Vibrio sp. 10N.247.310.34 TaxID=3229982 RepID=UPI00355108DA
VLVCRWNKKPTNVFFDFEFKDCDINVVSMNQHQWGRQCLKTSATHKGFGFLAYMFSCLTSSLPQAVSLPQARVLYRISSSTRVH